MEYAQLKPGRNFQPSRSLLYYVQRIVVEPRLRRMCTEGISAAIRALRGTVPHESLFSANEERLSQSLSAYGFTPLRILLTRTQVSDIHFFLRDKLLVNPADRKQVFASGRAGAGARMADYFMHDIVHCPHILELANRPSLLRLAARHLGCKPTISALVLRWSFPSNEPGVGVQSFHRDSDDWRFLKICVYLTDVDEECGPHMYVRGSHLTAPTVRLRTFSNDEVARCYGPEAAVAVTGESGFGFAVNTIGIHKGMVPLKHPRLMLQIQYSLLPVFAYRYRPVPYKGPVPLDRYINRLIVE
ncbi:MAG: hypothetical protein JWQ00_780 [Noviherbaspirillum sp.]|nr:hypothetical protein [Noviherbaspirillum sp.]